MRATRRHLLAFPLLAVAGCTPSPTIVGDVGSAPESPSPTRSPESAAVAASLAALDALVSPLANDPASWGADGVQAAWVAALRAQSSAHLSRLVAADPVVGGSTAFPTGATPTESAWPTTPAAVLAAVVAQVAAAAPALTAAVASASSSAERLLHASIMTALAASTTPALPPLEGGAEPAPFEGPTLPVALQTALSHAWALIRGLELGLGRLPREHPLQAEAVERLDAVRDLRNALLAELPGPPPRVQTWALPTAMTTPEEIRSAWAALETSMLDAVGGVVCADDTAQGGWLQVMLSQVPQVHRCGGRLPHWPGWVARS